MIILMHVVIALASVASTTYLYFRPSKRKLYACVGSIGATLISGTYLVISTRSPLLPSCTTGLLYLALMATGTIAAYRKLVDGAS